MTDEIKTRIALLDKLVEVDKGTCSFCSGESDTLVRSNLSGKAICEECLHRAKEHAEIIPPGAISCLSCRSIDGFVIRYDGCAATFLFSGLDNHSIVIYIVSETTNSWERGKAPTGSFCLTCKATIPLWLLKHNRYVFQAHFT